jgi:short-subunit dehydrogenase
MLDEGHIVYGAARRVEKMEFITRSGGKTIKMDITNDDNIRSAVDRIITEEGRIDVLVNNSGYAIYGSVEETEVEDARKQFEVNLFGLGRLTQLVIPHMRKKGSGTIINMSSMGGKIYTPMGAWYHASKHALEGWSDCLRIELKQHNINVVIIEPGIIHTEFADVMYEPMLKRSANGPYSKMTKAIADSSMNMYKENNSSPPSVIADLASKAINSNRPRTRYSAGKMAKPMMFLRKYLGDKAFDSALLSQVK